MNQAHEEAVTPLSTSALRAEVHAPRVNKKGATPGSRARIINFEKPTFRVQLITLSLQSSKILGSISNHNFEIIYFRSVKCGDAARTG